MRESFIKNPKSFWALNATQFLGALNDNFFQLLLAFGLISIQGTEASDEIFAIAGAVFALPFLLFSAFAGNLADRISKRTVIVAMKLLEVLVMGIGVAAFMSKSPEFLYSVMFLMGTQSALFSPSKYGIIPELVGREGLSKGNGYLVAFTYLAIILGFVLAPFMTGATNDSYPLAASSAVVIALMGLGASLLIKKTPASGTMSKSSVFFIRDIWRTFKGIRRDGYLLLAVCASAYFLMITAFVKLNLIPYGLLELGMTKEQSGILFLFAAVGIGSGGLLSGRMSGRNVELGVVPIGAFGLTVTTLCLGFFPDNLNAVRASVFLLGVSAGLFIVPLNAFIQFKSPPKKIGSILAASSFIGWIGVLLASAWILMFSKLGLTPREGFLILGIMTLVLSITSFKVLPDFLVRFMVIFIVRIIYRIRAIGRENVPVEGPALLVANHVSWVDALLLLATQQRRIRFVMFRGMYEHKRLHWLFRLMRAIPISAEDPPRMIVQSLREARKALDDGYLVCIFAEGAITRSGMMREFRGGMEKIVKGSDYPIIPVYLGGVWGSVLSYAHGELLSRWPQKLPYPVTILFGKPVSARTPAHEVRQLVTELSCDYMAGKKEKRELLGEVFIRTARMNWKKQAMSDSMGKSLTFGEALTASLVVYERIKSTVADQEYIGLVLPTTAGAALCNVALVMNGKVPVNLNYTASKEAFNSSIEQCGIKTVITSREFLTRLENLDTPKGAVFLEDLMADVKPAEKTKAFLKARCCPLFLLRPKNTTVDSLATIIFSSGSTGMPKGVMLSHHNIQSDIEGFRMVLRPPPNENICSALPFFHSFGFTATLWLPLISGFGASYHPNPMEGDKIAQLVRETKSTLLITTPTFLLAYIRRAKLEDFQSLRLVVTGAEKLKTKVADAFEKKFNIRPLEGYGATELSPVVSVNLPDVELGDQVQSSNREGTVGIPIPGVAVKVVDPDTLEPVGLGEPGLLLVKGENVMQGYLGQPDKTAEVLVDGWYKTGDIVRVDGEGFITITDRLSRFSKIGGEMVPQNAVEDVYTSVLATHERVLAVTSIADDRKGERLVVLYTEVAGGAERLHEIMTESDLPNLWKPNQNSYYQVEDIPILGSGKLDILNLRKKAAEAAQ